MTRRLRGRHEVARLKQRLEATFLRIEKIEPDEIELRADFSRYLCVLVAGYLEQACKHLAIECSRRESSEKVARYATARLGNFQNASREPILQLVAAFDPDWRTSLEHDYSPELDAANSVVSNRHLIAHGESVGVSYDLIKQYYDQVDRLVARLADLFDPA